MKIRKAIASSRGLSSFHLPAVTGGIAASGGAAVAATVPFANDDPHGVQSNPLYAGAAIGGDNPLHKI